MLDQLGEAFLVQALDPTSADELRAQVASGQDWAGPEWQPSGSSKKRETSVCSPRVSGDTRDIPGRDEEAVFVGGRTFNGSHIWSRGCHDLGEGSTVGAGAPTGVGLDFMKRSPVGRSLKPSEHDRTREWGYKADGLGKILAFAARRRPGERRRREELAS